MKILRVRRGFTTNSSSANDWLTPGVSPPVQTGPPPKLPAIGETIILRPINVISPTAPQSVAWSNAAKIGGLIGLVVVAFAIERLVYFLWRRKKRKSDEEE